MCPIGFDSMRDTCGKEWQKSIKAFYHSYLVPVGDDTVAERLSAMNHLPLRTLAQIAEVVKQRYTIQYLNSLTGEEVRWFGSGGRRNAGCG